MGEIRSPTPRIDPNDKLLGVWVCKTDFPLLKTSLEAILVFNLDGTAEFQFIENGKKMGGGFGVFKREGERITINAKKPSSGDESMQLTIVELQDDKLTVIDEEKKEKQFTKKR